MYILLLSALLYFPVEFALEGWYVNIVACISILVTSFGFLGCMFGPKLYIILCQPEQNTEGALSCQISRFTFGHNLTPASVRRTQLSLYTPGGGLQKELYTYPHKQTPILGQTDSASPRNSAQVSVRAFDLRSGLRFIWPPTCVDLRGLAIT